MSETLRVATRIELEELAMAVTAYRQKVAWLQADCEHETVLSHTDYEYMTFRVCERCGYHEHAQWDSQYRYKDQRLFKRSYRVTWKEYLDACPERLDGFPTLVPVE